MYLFWKKLIQLNNYIVKNQSISSIFNNLYIEFSDQNEQLICKIPSFRNDLSREVDLYEEIARVFGYNNIQNSDKCSMILSKFVKDQRYIDNHIRTLLSSTGFKEHYSNSLLNKDEIEVMSFDSPYVRLSNPLSQEMEFLRNSLFCGLVKAVKFNESRQEKLFKLFDELIFLKTSCIENKITI